jgi:hypothetical protein
VREILFASFLFLTAHVHAAAPATHVVFAELWMSANPIDDPVQRREFIIGTLFPDIRYLGTVKREETHETGVTANLIRKSETSFIAGMRLHVFVDLKREKYLEKYGTHSKLKKISKKHRVLFLKMLEDEILWNDCEWNEIIEMLEEIYPEQLNWVDQATAEKWHQEMIRYFHQRPSLFLQQLADNNQGFLKVDAKTIKIWAEVFPQYVQDPYFIEYTENLKNYLFFLF